MLVCLCTRVWNEEQLLLSVPLKTESEVLVQQLQDNTKCILLTAQV